MEVEIKSYLCDAMGVRITMDEKRKRIFSFALPEVKSRNDLKLLEEEKTDVDNKVSLRVRRYSFPQSWPMEDVGVAYYNKDNRKDKPAIELHYCIVGNRYCENPACQNAGCALTRKHEKGNPDPIMEVVNVSFHPTFLNPSETSELANLFEEDEYVKKFSPCTKTKIVLEQILHPPYKGALKNIFLQSKSMELLLYSSDQSYLSCTAEECRGCKFLANKKDRKKIVKARDILINHLDSPVTIKELSHMVAINECYLKKGFKAMYGSTIYNYFQKERMERAKFLLHEKKIPVSEVAVMMGYSCISHFSTAFKKHTGISPKELL